MASQRGGDMKHRHSTKTGELKRLAMAAVVVASFLVPQASAAACSSGQVCHYTAFDYDTTWAHMRHYGNNDRWAVQFPELVLNDSRSALLDQLSAPHPSAAMIASLETVWSRSTSSRSSRVLSNHPW